MPDNCRIYRIFNVMFKQWCSEICIRCLFMLIFFNIWRDPWKNRISSTTMKLRKSLVKAVTQQKISSCLVLPPEIVMHDAFNVILWTLANICVVMHNDLGWKNRTTRYNCRFSVVSMALRVIFVHQKRPPIYASCMMISGGRTEQHVIIGFG